MTHMLVLTAALGKLDDASVATVSALIGKSPHWLSPGTACEFRTDDPQIISRVRASLIDSPVDANVVASANRRKKLLIADMDSTIINVECIDEIADFAGLKPQIAAITERAMRGEIEFESALRERVGLLKGLPEATLAKVYETRIRLNPGARILVATMADAGATAALVSGGFSYFTSRVADAAGFSINRANTLGIENGRLTGTVHEPILGREAKRQSLIELARNASITLGDTMAIGDGANDLDMIRESGLGIAYRAKPVVAQAAHARLDHADLSAALYLQGYKETELVI
ncbi:MAG: phosphoserine phosphatase SerB [Micropepsaceae bacterium]